MKKNIMSAIAVIGVFLFWYLFVSFVFYELNPAFWKESDRLGCIAMSTIVAIFVVAIVYTLNKEEKK